MATSAWSITERQRTNFGDAFQEAMELRGMSQVTLAEALGTTQSVISQWRYGKFACPPSAVFKIEKLLELPGGWLSRHYGYMPLDHDVDAPTLETTVLDDPDLTDKDKQALLAVIGQLRAHRQAMAEAEAKAAKPARKTAAKKAAPPRKLSRAASGGR